MVWIIGSQSDFAALQKLHGAFEQQAFGRDVQHVELAMQQALLDIPLRFGPLAGIQERGAHAELQQVVDLILHQRDQRRHDDADAGAQ